MFWYQPDPIHKPYSYECWTHDPRITLDDITVNARIELIGYVDLLYTTLEKNKYIGSFEMNNHPEQQEQDDYFFSVKEAKNHVESEYMAWRMIGTLYRHDGRDS